MINNKIIFLNIDGVLNSYSSKEPIDLEKVRILREIVESTDSQLVLSSSWKVFHDPEFAGYSQYLYLTECLASENLSLIDQTPDIGARPVEIYEWLKNHPNVTSWISLDDDFRPKDYDLAGLDSNRLLQTCSGLTQEHVQKAIEILRSKYESN